MDSQEPEVKISDSECSVHGRRPGPSALRHGKAQILQILPAASSEQPVRLHCFEFHSFRVLSDIHPDGPGSSERVGCLSCVRSAVMWTRAVYRHPDSDSSRMCPNHPRAVPHVPDSNSGLDSEYRFFPGERRTVVDDEAPSNGPKPRLKRSSCPTSETAHIKNS
ncbi:uncharacterized protein LOC103362665 isoform X4 [Stegastes partitus]|uniref:Uncharacterized protein LOC103362665 isoform X4 n=1 Tax=Stegastes partitus TaxID=144197 RepID=A0A9Y4KDM2_9TELE|nr:PREDICTED: uncharacterized protein LOC103362665 isoform X4 [Stegastes partitus]